MHSKGREAETISAAAVKYFQNLERRKFLWENIKSVIDARRESYREIENTLSTNFRAKLSV